MFYVRELLKNPEVLARIKCSEAEKESIRGAIDFLMEMVQASRNDGLLYNLRLETTNFNEQNIGASTIFAKLE
jgi:hypothetical protein